MRTTPVLLALSLLGCGDGLAPPPKPFELAPARDVAVRVLAGGAPLAGARVQISRRAGGGLANPGVVAVAQTDGNGEARSLAALVDDEQPLEVLVVAPGWIGAWEPDGERAQHGGLAPAARLLVDGRALASLEIRLEKEAP